LINIESRLRPIDDLDPDCSLTHASFCVYNIAPDLISDLLDISPTRQRKIGEKIVSKYSSQVAVSRENFWVIDSDLRVVSKDTRSHLNWLLAVLEPKASQIMRLQQMAGVKMNIRCIWFSATGQGGPALWPEQMEKMAKLNLECYFRFVDYSGKGNPRDTTDLRDEELPFAIS
jgi:hypothetical protein